MEAPSVPTGTGTSQETPSALWPRILMFLAVIGPGIITSNIDNDAGGIATYSLCGANFGYSLVWTLIPITFFLLLIQEMSVRLGAVTGKGLSDLIREKFGVRITFYVLIIIILTNIGNIIAEFAGIAAALEVVGISRFVSVPLGALFIWVLVLKGNYKSVEKVFLFACLFYFSYIITGFMVKPDFHQIVKASFPPEIRFDRAYIAMGLGLLGTTIAPWMQFYLQSSVVEKRLSVRDLTAARVDVFVGSIVVGIVAFFIVMVCAEVLYPNNISIETAKDAALALKPLAGEYCTYLFAFGLLNASLFAASILPLSTAYLVCEGLGWESGIDNTFMEAPLFYILYTLLVFGGALVILIPNIPLIPIMYVSQIINAVVLPIIIFFMLTLINDKRLMGEHVNRGVLNLVSYLAAILFSLLVLSFAVINLI
ncbi:Nramp family divalent metal transporter [candidate division KSB1 bacterium]